VNEKTEEKLLYGNFRTEDGKLFLLRCPECKLENYAPAVASGECAWCGWKEKQIKEEKLQ
jgi:ssDNA-binding Zn-finger/Zn-ribbon topoisomerase 1